MGRTLRGSSSPPARDYDVALLDLDGVVYIGQDAVAGVPEALRRAREAGMRLAFVTNNASRTPDAVAEHLRALGVAADADEVVTSSQAAAHYLADQLADQLTDDRAVVLVVGTTALADALTDRGLLPVLAGSGEVRGAGAEAGSAERDGAVIAIDGAEHPVAAVVQGYSPDTNWRMLADASVAINHRALWVATNVDPTVPSARGPLPGNGSLVQSLRHATGVDPVVTGKPDPTMHRETVLRTGARNPVVVGDRLDTDIEGANAVGCASLLVLSGVTSERDLLAAPERHRPDHLAPDAGGLLRPHRAPHPTEDGARCGAWRVRRVGERLELAHDPDSGDADDDGLDALRALCAAAWAVADAATPSGGAMGLRAPDVRAADCDPAAAAQLSRLDLA